MIVLSPDAVDDVARLRTFLNEINPDAARRAMAAILTAIERIDEFPELGKSTEDAENPSDHHPVRRVRVHRALHSRRRDA